MNRIFYLFILFFSIVHTQTFFTIPRSVWRVSIINSVGSGNWIGSGGLFNKGIRDISYMPNDSTIAAFVHQTNKMKYLNFGNLSSNTPDVNAPRTDPMARSTRTRVITFILV